MDAPASLEVSRHEPPADAIAQAVALARAASIDVGGIEYLVGRDDGDTRHQAAKVGGTGNSKHVTHAGHRLDLIVVRAHDLAAVDATLLVHGPEHVGQREVDPERGLTGNDARVVHTARELSDDLVVGGRLELDLRHIRRRHRRGT